MTASDRTIRGKTEALKDANNLNPKLKWPDVDVVTSGNEVAVTVTYTFNTLTNFLGIGSATVISRTVRMPIL